MRCCFDLNWCLTHFFDSTLFFNTQALLYTSKLPSLTTTTIPRISTVHSVLNHFTYVGGDVFKSSWVCIYCSHQINTSLITSLHKGGTAVKSCTNAQNISEEEMLAPKEDHAVLDALLPRRGLSSSWTFLSARAKGKPASPSIRSRRTSSTWATLV